jgi:hypothetical protein
LFKWIKIDNELAGQLISFTKRILKNDGTEMLHAVVSKGIDIVGCYGILPFHGNMVIASTSM